MVHPGMKVSGSDLGSGPLNVRPISFSWLWLQNC